jgi:hypothetical protein
MEQSATKATKSADILIDEFAEAFRRIRDRLG